MNHLEQILDRARLARREHRLDDALRHYNEAASLHRQSNDPLPLAHTLRHIGDVLCELGDAHRAEPLYDEALQIYRNSTDASRLDFANALRAYAVLKQQKGEVSVAKSLWEEARSLYRELNISEGVIEADRSLALLG